jgi:dTDP-4-amino-4,6-dideoxygalactose transaminase
MSTRTLAGALALCALTRPSSFAIPASAPWLHIGDTRYHVPQHPCRMTAFSAALLRASKDAADAESVQRRANARELLDDLPLGTHVQSVVAPANAECGYLRLPIRITGGWDDLAGVGPARRLGIAPTYPTTLAALAQVRARLRSSGPWPGAEKLVREMITLPTHSLVTSREREIILDLLVRWQRGRHAARSASPWFSARSYNAT